MTVEPDSAPRVERNGQTFYFCSEGCRRKFLSARAATVPLGTNGLARFSSNSTSKLRRAFTRPPLLIQCWSDCPVSAGYSWTMTGVPTWIFSKKCSAITLGSRTQPCDAG